MRIHEILAEARRLDAAFHACFAGSKVVKNDEPMMFLSTGRSVQEFHRRSHFGTARAAKQRIKQRWPQAGYYGARVIPV